MSGFQPTPFPASRQARLQQHNGGAIVDSDDPEHEPMSLGEKVGLVFMWATSIAIVVGGLNWLLCTK